MASYIDTGYGAISANIPGSMIVTLTGLIRSHIRNSSDMDLLIDGTTTAEAIANARVVTGHSFQGFLKANYHNGLGRRVRIVRAILQFLDNEISGHSLSSIIEIDYMALSSMLIDNAIEDHYPNPTSPNYLNRNQLARLDAVTEDDFFRVIETIGANALSRLIISFIGVQAYEA